MSADAVKAVAMTGTPVTGKPEDVNGLMVALATGDMEQKNEVSKKRGCVLEDAAIRFSSTYVVSLTLPQLERMWQAQGVKMCQQKVIEVKLDHALDETDLARYNTVLKATKELIMQREAGEGQMSKTFPILCAHMRELRRLCNGEAKVKAMIPCVDGLLQTHSKIVIVSDDITLLKEAKAEYDKESDGIGRELKSLYFDGDLDQRQKGLAIKNFQTNGKS